jgi:acetyl esterase/lipase
MKRISLFVCIACMVAVAQDQPAPADELFLRLDRNRDGKITKDEVPPERQAVFSRIDSDGDGSVSPEEHQAFRQRQMQAPQNGQRPQRQQQPLPETDFANVAYGPHPRNLFDLWRPTANTTEGESCPLVIFYHGGGFRSGDKSRIDRNLLQALRQNGVAVAAANYRLTDTAPFPAQMHDAALALQFIRLHADEYGIDPERIAAIGGSAGAGISLWLAFHDDLAKPDSEDPVARQSTRLTTAVGLAAQTTYDPREHQRIFASTDLESAMFAFYGMENADQMAEPRFQALFEEASPINHATADDPPVLLSYSQPNADLPPNPPGKLYIHHPKFGFLLKEKLDGIGVGCTLKLREDYPEGNYQRLATEDQVRFLCEKLGVATPE